MHYQPRRTLGLLVGAVLASWSAAIGVLLLNAGITAGVGPAQLAAYGGAAVAAAIALLFAYWCYGLATLAYRVDRNGLVIEWGTTRQVIPSDSSPSDHSTTRPASAASPGLAATSDAPSSPGSATCSSTPRTSRRRSCST